MKIFLIIPLLMLVLVMGMPFSNAQGVPDWVKNTAGWWASDAISETEFVNAIEFLVNEGIIQTESNSECVDDILKFFDDRERIVEVCKEHNSNITELIPYAAKNSFNSHGFVGDEFSLEKPEGVYRIFMVGGSTILGSGVTHDSAIPAIMQKMFDSRDLDLKVEVINAGVSGANTITEYNLISEKIVNYEPDLIMMYDGWNDLSADYPVDETIFNMEDICLDAFIRNFDVVFTLQPIAGFGNKILTEQEKINSLTGENHNGFQLIQGKSTYEWLAKEMQSLSNDAKRELGQGVCESYDLRGLFDDVNGAVYWDQGHMLHTGNLIIAEKFFEISMKKIEPGFASDGKFRKIISDYNSIPIATYLFEKLGISDETFQTKFRDIKTIPGEQGDFFGLKAKFNGNVEEIFVGKDLRNVDLDKIILAGQDLTGADLSGMDLRDIDLRNTIIRNVDLSKSNLEGKDLSGMDLRGVNFSSANLKNVNFKDSIIGKTIQFVELTDECSSDNPVTNMAKEGRCMRNVLENESIRTNFQNADLRNTQFGNTDEEKIQLVTFADFSGADLTNSNIVNAVFRGCDFSNSILDNTYLESVYFFRVNFDDAEMRDFDFDIIWFQDSTFVDTKFTDGFIDLIFLVNTSLVNAELDGTIIKELVKPGFE